MQSNFGSFICFYGSKAQTTVKELLERDMIHFLGTDVHRQNSIYSRIPEIIETIKKYTSEEKIKELTEINPGLILRNEEFYIPEPQKAKKGFKNFFK